MSRVLRVWTAAVIGASGCNAVQDAVPGGVCSWVEPNPELADCSYVLETVVAAHPEDELSQAGTYNRWGFVVDEQTNGAQTFASTYDDRGRQISASNGQSSYTADWDGCSSNILSFDNDQDGVVDAVRTAELRQGIPEFYTITYESGEPYSVGEYESEWSGRWLDSESFSQDGVITSRTERTHSEEDGLHREEVRYFGTGDTVVWRDVFVTDGERELNGNDRTVLEESYGQDGSLTYRRQSSYTSDSSSHLYDIDGDGEVDVVDDIDLDSEGRLLVRRRNYLHVERPSEVRVNWTCE